jgi:[phosphatase 2A protein]-leucine-carboxy methyltransferase
MFPPPQHGQGNKDADAPIRLTDTDAALARLSAVQKGYLHDPYVKHVVPRSHLQPPRPPLINVGTFVRSAAIDSLVDGWLQLSEHEGQLCQIVSLGAGSDTRFWRIAVRVQNLFVTANLVSR